MMSQSSYLLPAGLLIDNRYRLLSHLRSGGFGRIYLAEDICCQQQKCILNQLTAQEENSEDLSKTQKLYFALYQLKHSQIPEVRSMLRVKIREGEALFLVQEYVEGKSYGELLKERKQFNEPQVIQLLFDILPVLEYIHSQNIVHRNISPENLIQRNSDGRPVLINFDSVQLNTEDLLKNKENFVGNYAEKKAGTAETEIQSDLAANIKSDLYSLAVTVLVLLTGKQPQELYDIYHGNWKWQEEIKVSDNLGSVLAKMLAQNTKYRYSSATEVIQALQQFSSPIALEIPTLIVNQPLQQPNYPIAAEVPTTQFTQPIPQINSLNHKEESTAIQTNKPLPQTNPLINNQVTSAMPTLVVAPGNNSKGSLNNASPIKNQVTSSSEQPTQQIVPKNSKIMGFFKAIFVGIVIVVLPGIVTFNLVKDSNWQPEFFSKLFKLEETTDPEIDKIQPSEIDRRIQALDNPGSFYEKVDRSLYAKHPELGGRPLTNNPDDRKFRDEWYKIAAELLEKPEN